MLIGRKNAFILLLLMGSLLFLIIILSFSSVRPKEYRVEEGTWETETIEPADEKVKISISVCDNASAIDVYVLRLEYFSKNSGLKENLSRTPESYFEKIFHNVTSQNFTFDPPDDESYVIVLDNSDNSLTNDTVPVRDVVVELNIKYTKSEIPMTIKGIVVSLLAITFVVYTIVLYIRKNNHRKNGR